MLREERKETKRALLQLAVRRERVNQDALVTIEHAGAKIFCASDLPFELRELMPHFSSRSVQRFNQSCVEFRQRLFETLDYALQLLLALVEAARQSAWQRSLLHFRAQMLAAGKHVTEIGVVLREKTRNRRLDDRETRARQNRGHAHAQHLIHDLRLSHVGNFRRASNVGRGWQNGVLEDRAQQRIGGKTPGVLLNFTREVEHGHFPLIHEEAAVLCSYWLARSRGAGKKQCAFARDFHLKMKACAFKLFRPGQKRLSKLAAFQDDLTENRGEQAMDARVELIEKDHSTARQKTRHEFAECGCVRILRRVRFVENPSELGSEGSIESRGGRADHRLNRIAQRDFTYTMADFVPRRW